MQSPAADWAADWAAYWATEPAAGRADCEPVASAGGGSAESGSADKYAGNGSRGLSITHRP